MKKQIDYKKLIINPENYRFDPVDTQEQAIDLMLQEKGQEIFNLAKDILEHGFDNAKDFRVVKSNKNYLVLDGNRRATALKCLWDVNLIKNTKLKEKFKKLSINKTELVKTVNAFVYATEKDAAAWIKLDHTGKNAGVGQDSWGSAEIDRFGYKFEGKISPAMQSVMLVEGENNEKFDTKKLKISTINRILSNPESRSYLGIDIKDKKIIFLSKKKEVVKRLHKLFQKIVSDNVKVDTVYTKDKSNKFMLDLFGDKPSVSIKPASKSQQAQNTKNTPRTKNSNVIFFGEKISLKKGEVNNLYRDINDLYSYYEHNKSILSPNFPALIRMSLRLIVESATPVNKKIDTYLKANFDTAKNLLSQDQKTFLHTQGIKKDNIVSLLHVGAHKYSASSNFEQTIAISYIIGAMLKITHKK